MGADAIDTLMENGAAALAEGRWQEARGHFAHVLDEGHRSPEALDGLGRACWWLGGTDEAVTHREEAYARWGGFPVSATALRHRRCLTGGMAPDDLPIVPFASAAEMEAWLEDHHTETAGIWLKLAKKGSGIPSVTYAEAVDVALCFGWIDGQANRFDDDWYLQRFTPRRTRSKWSQINRGKVEDLTRQGRMRPAGLAEVERAKADGRWEAAYPSPRAMAVPDDLQRALDADPAAAEAFAGLSASQRYGVLYRLHDAKRPETRVRRIDGFVAKLAAGLPPL